MPDVSWGIEIVYTTGETVQVGFASKEEAETVVQKIFEASESGNSDLVKVAPGAIVSVHDLRLARVTGGPEQNS